MARGASSLQQQSPKNPVGPHLDARERERGLHPSLGRKSQCPRPPSVENFFPDVYRIPESRNSRIPASQNERGWKTPLRPPSPAHDPTPPHQPNPDPECHPQALSNPVQTIPVPNHSAREAFLSNFFPMLHPNFPRPSSGCVLPSCPRSRGQGRLRAAPYPRMLRQTFPLR